jgi:hypothetical protein
MPVSGPAAWSAAAVVVAALDDGVLAVFGDVCFAAMETS